MAVEMVRLSASHGFTNFVRFPPGWQRPSAGSYESNEEFIVLDGALEMNGATYSAGDWVFVPAGVERSETSTPIGALTVAWFHGPARWTSDTGEGAVVVSRLDLQNASQQNPFGGKGRLLCRDDSSSSWLIEPPIAGQDSPIDAEIFDLDARIFASVPIGSSIPDFHGRCFCRSFEPDRTKETR